MPCHFKKLVLLISFLLLCVPREVSAIALTGLADLEYTDFQEKNQDTEIEASQFKQKYEIKAYTGGIIIDRGIGYYVFSVGYQYLKVNTTYDSGDLGSGHFNPDGSVFVWDGSINIAPKKIPFRLNLYSGDTNPLGTSTTSIPGVLSGLAPDVTTNVEGGGISRSSGLNLHFEFGGKGGWGGNGNGGNGNGGNGNGGNGNGGNGNGGNGNGGNGNGGNGNGGNGNGGNGGSFIKLRLPKGVLDYAKTYTSKEDVYESKDDFRFSLNDRRNWFHFKWLKYDNLLGGGDYAQQEFQIGNVDRNGGRSWFYLNNWVLFTADADYLRIDTADTSGTIDTYNINIFASAFRSRWDSSFYGSYNQNLNSEGYTGSSKISLPLYVNINPSRDVIIAWKNSFTQDRAWNMDNPATSTDEETTTTDTKTISEDISSTHYHLTSQDLSLKSRYSISKKMTVGDGSNTSQALSFTLDSAGGKSYSYNMGYSANVVKDDDPGDIADNSLSQTVSVTGRYAVNERIGISASQSATITEAEASEYPETRGYGTSVGVNLYIHRTLSIDLGGGRGYSENIGYSHSEDMSFSGNINFTPVSWLKVTSSNGYTQNKGETPTVTTDRSAYSSSNSMQVKVNRSFSSRTGVNYNVEDDRSSMNKTTTLKIEEGFEYVRIIQRYRAKTLFTISGSANYTESTAVSGGDSTETSSEGASLAFNHNPYRHLSWGISGNYNSDNTGSSSEGGAVYVSIPFPKLNISASYSFSKADKNEVDAQKFILKVSKTF